MTAPVQDLRHIKRLPKYPRGAAQGRRPLSQIVGITWHQTANGHLDADHPKLLNIPAHIIMHRDGTWTWLHAFDALVYHGHALNNGTVGVEVDARAAGTEGVARTFWRSTTERLLLKTYAELAREATDAQLLAIPELMRLICAESPTIRANWAHRQGHSSRTSDPGSRIWKAVKRAEVGLGLKDVQDLAIGSGTPIPQVWRWPGP